MENDHALPFRLSNFPRQANLTTGGIPETDCTESFSADIPFGRKGIEKAYGFPRYRLMVLRIGDSL